MMKIESVKKIYTRHKIVIYSVCALIILISLSWYGATNRYSYNSYEECLLIKMQGNEKLFFVAEKVCDKEIEIEFEKMKKDWAYLFNFEGAINGGYTAREIYEHLSNTKIEFLSMRSVSTGIRKLFINDDENRMIRALKGGVVGGIVGYLIGLFIEISKFLFKRFKIEK